MNSFLYNELPLVAPDVVLCTGDLTDAKSESTLTSVQHKEEWIAYHRALEVSGISKRKGPGPNLGAFWWDQRGNHDCWNTPSFLSVKNMFKDYSMTKEKGFAFDIKKSFGTYSFVAIDGWYFYLIQSRSKCGKTIKLFCFD